MLVSALLVFTFAAVLQVCLTIHVRNTVIDSAMTGARVLAMGDGTADDARRVTRDLITASVGKRYATNISIDQTTANGHQVAVVRVRTGVPVIGLWGPTDVLTLEGRALVEPLDRGEP